MTRVSPSRLTLSHQAGAQPLILRPRGITTLDPIVLRPEEAPASLGRATGATARIPDASVSRDHALLDCRGGRWIVTDRSSRHGTFVNSVRLEPGVPTDLTPGDTISFGPCLYAVGDETSRDRRLSTCDDPKEGNARVRSIAQTTPISLDSMRLALLLDAAESFAAATDEHALARSACAVLRRGVGFPRAYMLRPADGEDEYDIIGGEDEPPSTRGVDGYRLSRTLLRSAMGGQTVSLEQQPDLALAVSAVNLDIRAAMCVPVFIGAGVDCVIYLDARGAERAAHDDAPAFAGAVARLCGLALASLRRADLERRQNDLLRELSTARDVQRRLLPAPSGRIGAMRYAVRATPGRFVAGDFFSIAPLEGGRAAVLIGDVAGKGAGPGLLMASLQAFIQGELSAGREEPDVLTAAANRFIAARALPHEFSTMWLAVIDPAQRRLSYVDAGHGFAALSRAGAPPTALEGHGAMPLGVDTDQTFLVNTIPFEPGDQLLLFSDGVVEQRDPDGAQFTFARALESADNHADPDAHLDHIIERLTAFAGCPEFADDVTVAVVQHDGEGPA